jgi:hypothetical protein
MVMKCLVSYAVVLLSATIGAGCSKDRSSTDENAAVGQLNVGTKSNPNEEQPPVNATAVTDEWGDPTLVKLWGLLVALDEAEASQNQIRISEARDAVGAAITTANEEWRTGWTQLMVVKVEQSRVIVARCMPVEHTNCPPLNAVIVGHKGDKLGMETVIAYSASELAPVLNFFESLPDNKKHPMKNDLRARENFLELKIGENCDMAIAKQLAAGDWVRCSFDVVGCEKALDGHGVGLRIANEKVVGAVKTPQPPP